MEITGTRGVIWVNRGHGRTTDGPPLTLYADGKTESFGFPDADTGWQASFIHSVRHFINALRSGDPPSLTVQQGREVCASLWPGSFPTGWAARFASTKWGARRPAEGRHEPSVGTIASALRRRD